MSEAPKVECPQCQLTTKVDESCMCVHCGEILPTWVMDELRTWKRGDQ